MKRITIFLITSFIICNLFSYCLAKGDVELFNGYWNSRSGTIIKIEGNEGVLISSPIVLWRSMLNQVTIKNIRQEGNKWVASECISPNNGGVWQEVGWVLIDDRITRYLTIDGEKVETYFERSEAAASAFPEIENQDDMKMHAFGAKVGYTTFQDDSYELYGVKVDTELDNSILLGLNYTYFPIDYFSLEFGVDYVSSTVTLTGGGYAGKAGDVKQVPMTLAARFHFAASESVFPFLLFGFGYYMNDIDQNDEIIEALYGAGANVSVDNDFGYFIGAGSEFFFDKRTSIGLDVRYTWQEIKASVNMPGFTDSNFDINPLTFSVFMKYYF